MRGRHFSTRQGRAAMPCIANYENSSTNERWRRRLGLTATRPEKARCCNDGPGARPKQSRISPGKRGSACAGVIGCSRAKASSRCKSAPPSHAGWPASSGRSAKPCRKRQRKDNNHDASAVCGRMNRQLWENPRGSQEASGNGMALDIRARQLPDESVVMR